MPKKPSLLLITIEDEQFLEGMLEQVNKTTIQAMIAIDEALEFVENSYKRIDSMKSSCKFN